MHNLVVALVCLACTAHGRRLRISPVQAQSSLTAESNGRESVRQTNVNGTSKLLRYLTALDPTAAFLSSGLGAHLALGTPKPTGFSSVIDPLISKGDESIAFLRTRPVCLLAAVAKNNRSAVDIGSIVEFTKGNSINLGAVAERDGKKKWAVLTSNGNTVSIDPKQICWVVETNVATNALAERLKSLEASAEEFPSFEEMEELYEMVVTEGELSLTELSELYFGDSSINSLFAMYRCLTVSDGGRMFFRPSGKFSDVFSVRPTKDIENSRKTRDVELRKQQALDELKARFDVASASSPLNVDAESKDVQEKISAVARFGCRVGLEVAEAGSEQTDVLARAFLQDLGHKPTMESARIFMVGLGLWNQHENLDLIRLSVPAEFTDKQNASAEALLNTPLPDKDAARRRDLTHLHSFAIDESSTQEIDDAVSIELLDESEGGGELVWVHIADPTRYVPLGSELEVEASRRGSTIYLPTRTIPMLPMGLAAGPCSLSTAGEDPSCALSIGVRLDPFGFLDSTFEPILTPSHVRVQRLTYDDVDILLDSPRTDGSSIDASEDPPVLADDALDVLRRLKSASKNRLDKRIMNKCMESISGRELPDLSVKAVEDEDAPDGWDVQVNMGGARPDGPARRIVTEMMLLAGEVVATYAEKHKLPMPYRSQAFKEFLTAEEIAACPEGPCRAWLAIRCMGKGNVAHNFFKHEGLGLEGYVQVTSPIRRYADLAVHYQLKAHLRGDRLPFPADAKEDGSLGPSALVDFARTAGSLARDLERSANSYWLEEWLKRQEGAALEALVLGPIFRNRPDNQEYKLMLTESGATVDCISGSRVEPGDIVRVYPDRLGKLAVF